MRNPASLPYFVRTGTLSEICSCVWAVPRSIRDSGQNYKIGKMASFSKRKLIGMSRFCRRYAYILYIFMLAVPKLFWQYSTLLHHFTKYQRTIIGEVVWTKNRRTPKIFRFPSHLSNLLFETWQKLVLFQLFQKILDCCFVR